MRTLVLPAVLALLALAPVTASAQSSRSTPVLKSSTDAHGRQIQYPAGTPEITSQLVEFPPGSESGRHMHPIPTHVYVLEGSVVIETEDGQRQEMRQGDAALEPAGVWMNAKNPGTSPARVFVVFVGEAGKPVTVRPPATSGAAAPAPQPAPSPQ